VSDERPLRSYEITWHSGHVETIHAHQVSWPNNAANLFGGATTKPSLIQFMGEIDGQWTLVLSAHEDDIRTVRDVTVSESLGEESA
jgi:hypothetical protein